METLLPGSVLVHDALVYIAARLAAAFWDAALDSLVLAASAAVLAVGFAVVLAYARRQTRLQLIQAASTLPAISYAVPGTVLAMGLLIPLAGLDTSCDHCSASRRAFSYRAPRSRSCSPTQSAYSPLRLAR